MIHERREGTSSVFSPFVVAVNPEDVPFVVAVNAEDVHFVVAVNPEDVQYNRESVFHRHHKAQGPPNRHKSPSACFP